ncbi:MAG: hypothetical protein FWH14_01130 [Oscillospiraceae bacterium]|nr:hypothetical protein [Oscillospiraceae bacterium]
MKSIFKYAFLQNRRLRVSVFAVMLGINLVFSILSLSGIAPGPVMILGITLSSIAIGAVFIINIIADALTLRSIFGTPHGYNYALAPVKSGKILLANVVSIIVQDCIALSVAIFGVVIQSLSFTKTLGLVFDSLQAGDALFWSFFITIFTLLAYAFLLMLVVFGISLKNSLFFSSRLSPLLAFIGVIISIWVLGILDILLIPFGDVSYVFMFVNVTLIPGFNIASLIYAIVIAAKTTLLFLASSRLIERKANL